MSVPLEDLSIAPVTPADRDVVIDLLFSQLDEHEIPLAKHGPAPSIEAAVDGMLTGAARGAILVARTAGTVAGVAYLAYTWTLEKGGSSVWLEELYVVPALRGRGIGSALLTAAMAHAAAHGCHSMDLEVEASHARAAQLYTRHGFRPLPRSRYTRTLTH